MARHVNSLILFFLTSLLCVSGDISSLIVGGDRSTEIHPYRVSMRRIDFGDFHGCGGSILNSRWILTAAHCIGYFETTEDIAAVRIVVGSLNPRVSGTRYSMIEYVLHPAWTRSFINLNDVGLVKTESPIMFNQFVQPISVSRQQVRAGDVVTSGGWGMEKQGLFPNVNMAEEMNEIDLTVISNLECRRRLLPIPSFSMLISGDVFCTYMQRGVGLCSGDSGSGITMNGQLVGIASMAIPCANGFPDWYPRLNIYADWIERVIST